MSHKLIIKDAAWQLIGRILSAIMGLLVIKMISPYLGPYRFGDYKTILDYFAIWGALADFGLYVIALKTLGAIKERYVTGVVDEEEGKKELQTYYGKFVFSRMLTIGLVYVVAIVVAYLIPSYTSNPYLIRGLPLGMLFSASFMMAGIVQLPLQLFWKMEQVSLALVGARFCQLVFLAVVIYWLFPQDTFGDSIPRAVFSLIVFSILLSGVAQGVFVWRKSQRFLPLKLVPDFSYTRGLIKQNWQYGSAYFLSSFHTLFVAILFSVFYPTIEGFDYVGIWSLALVFMTVLIIIPATLGNSMIHKVGSASEEAKRSSLGHFLTLVVWVGTVILLGCTAFADQIIYFLGDASFLGTGWGDPGSNTLMPWMSLILVGSFVKQSFNYNFVAHDKQHLLLWVNLVGVVVGVPLAIWFVRDFGLIGGLWGQGLLELLFMGGAIFFSWKEDILPRVPWKMLFAIVGLCLLFLCLSPFVQWVPYDNLFLSLLWGLIFFLPFLFVSYFLLKKIARGLSV